ncbi:MAG: hypothetical protein PVG53_12640 [Holophagae bacterium]
MTAVRCLAAALVVGAVASLVAPIADADEPAAPRNVDSWHAVFAEGAGTEIVDSVQREWTLGLYPNAGAAVGAPEWIGYQLHGFVSLSDGSRFSLFGGYGYERGFNRQSHLVTIGWGGVRRLSAARPQRGFYGKFLRYRRIHDAEHGLHHGLSAGVENCAGLFAVTVEVGAARSADNHWVWTAQVAVKVAVPIVVPL